MSRGESPALRGTLLGRLLMLWNPIMKRLLQSPLHWPWSRWFAVIEWTGRRSGRRFSTPVAYLLRGDEVWVTTGDAWWRNLHSNPKMRLWLSGTRVEGDAAAVTDPQESVQLHLTMFEAKPFFARLAGLPPQPGAPEIAKRSTQAACSFGSDYAVEWRKPRRRALHPDSSSRPRDGRTEMLGAPEVRDRDRGEP